MGFLIGTLLVLFFLNCLFLILLVLLQTGKNSSLGIMGGASQSVFGSSSVDIMTKITRGSAIAFLVLALLLSFLFSKKEEKLPIIQDETIMAPPTDSKPDEKQPENTPSPEKP